MRERAVWHLILAASLAESGKSVLLIDADLRKSVLMGRVTVDQEVMGLAHYLSKQAKLSDVICATTLPKFHIIFSGIVPPNPGRASRKQTLQGYDPRGKRCL